MSEDEVRRIVRRERIYDALCLVGAAVKVLLMSGLIVLALVSIYEAL